MVVRTIESPSTPDGPGARLLSAAFGFHSSAKLLFDAQGLLIWPVSFVNLAFAIEVGLKGYLRSVGLKRAQQKKLGHDLVAAFDLAVERGFRPSVQRYKSFIDRLSPYHQDMTLRYLEGDKIDLPPMQQCIDIVGSLIFELATQARVFGKPEE